MFRAFVVGLALAVCIGPAAAQQAKPVDPKLVSKAEAALVEIGVMTADFTFNNAAGANTGRLFVDRLGGRLRMEFDPPMRHLVIADGARVDFIGGDGTRLNAGVQTTPLALIFGPDSSLDGDVEVVEAATKGKVAMIVVAQKGMEDEGRVILHFKRGEQDWTLSGWGYVDDEGRYTRTALRNMHHGGVLDAALFQKPSRDG